MPNNFYFSVWYSMFSEHTYPARILSPLPSCFVEYLYADGIVLPERDAEVTSDPETDEISTEEHSYFNSEFFKFEDVIQKVIEEYKFVVPKLNHSSPKDALWATTAGILRCQTPDEVYCLMKSSDRVQCDLSALESSKSNLELVLKKWIEMDDSTEFRCFVRRKTLVAISQRNLEYHFAFLKDKIEEISNRIEEFFTLLKDFPEESFIFDVYLEKDSVKLIDIDRLDSHSSCLLFSFKELNEMYKGVSFRVIKSEKDVIIKASNQNHIPADFFRKY